MLGGGPGSGKSEIVLKRLIDTPSVVFDGTLGGFESAVEKIDYALAKGMKVELHPVYAPVELATLFNQVRTRHVPFSDFVETHFNFRNTIPKLLEKYGDRIKITPSVNNVWGEKGGVAAFNDLRGYLNKEKMQRLTVIAKTQKVSDYIKRFGLEKTKEDLPQLIQKSP